MVEVEGGTFMMGLDEMEAEHTYETPRHEVTLHDYKIGRHEVSQQLWDAVMESIPDISDNGRLPVANVSWYDIQTFIKKLNKLTGRNFRLPTEAEWEFAARGGKKSKGFALIGGNDADSTAWHYGNSGGLAHERGLLQPNELGIYDMGGNVSEWVQDWYGHYPSQPTVDPKGAKSSEIGKIIRGGCFTNLSLYNKPGCRFVSNPGFKSPTIGFRLAE